MKYKSLKILNFIIRNQILNEIILILNINFFFILNFELFISQLNSRKKD